MAYRAERDRLEQNCRDTEIWALSTAGIYLAPESEPPLPPGLFAVEPVKILECVDYKLPLMAATSICLPLLVTFSI